MAEWRETTVGDLGAWFSGGTPSKANSAYWGGEIPWVSAKDMKVAYLHDSIDHVTEAAVGRGTRVVPRGSLLMVVRGMILLHSFPVARLERPMAFNQDLKALVTHEGIESRFVLHWLQSNAQRLRRLATESTHGTKRIPSEALFSTKLPCPPPDEQRAIAEVLSDVDSLANTLAQLIAKKRDLKQAAMQQILSRQTRLSGFTGEWESRQLGNCAAIRNYKVMPQAVPGDTLVVELEHSVRTAN